MTPALFDLTGRTAVITGGGSGIGLGMAGGLLGAGASVALLGRSQQRLDAAADRLRAEHPDAVGRVWATTCDVAREEQVVEALARVRAELGGIDACFANAAVDGDYVGTLDTTAESFRDVTLVDLDGTFLTLREAARHMVDHGRGGSLVAVSSIGARTGMPRQLPYAASKGGVISLVNAMAVDLAKQGIRVNALLPGFIDTELTREAFASGPAQKLMLPRIPARRWGTATDFAGIAVYLASDASTYHSGDAIVIDGGFSVT